METAIGNYVHYHKQNYEDWGINQKGTISGEKWNDAASAFKKQLLEVNEINTLVTETKELEDQYNDFFYPKDKTSKQIKQFREVMERVIQERLNEQFQLRAGKFDIRTFTLKETELAKQLNAAIDKTQKGLGKIELKYVKSCQQLLEKTQLLYRILEDNEFKNIKAAKTRIKQAKRQLEQIQTNLINVINENNGKKVRLDRVPEDVETMKSLIQEFNRMAIVSNQNGEIFEWVLPFIQFQATALGKQELKIAMEEMVRDTKTQLGQVNITIDMPDLKDNNLTDIDIIENNIKVSTFTTRSKTDVIINYNDSNNIAKTKTVSAKSLKKLEVHLVHNTSLYNMLLLSNSAKFATHYLNVVTVAPGQKSGPERIVEANRLIKGLILKLSAEGFDSSSASELLIINDYSNKRIRVYNIKVLVYLIQKSLIEDGRFSDMIKIPDNFTISQSFDKESKDKRILKVIRSTNQYKINTVLNAEALDSYYSLLGL